MSVSLGLCRAVLRRQFLTVTRQIPAARNASATSEAASTVAKTASDVAQAAKSTTAPIASKASEGLSKATSQAGYYASKATDAAGRVVGGLGGTLGSVTGAVQGLIPPTIYYFRVGLELGKIIFEQRKMSPPSIQTFQTYMLGVMRHISSPSSITQTAFIHRLVTTIAPSSNAEHDRKTAATWAVIGAEILGFFTVGEMIGKFKIVGYRSSKDHHHE